MDQSVFESPIGEALVLMAQLLGEVQRDHLALVRDELAPVRRLGREIDELQAAVNARASATSTAAAPGSVPGSEAIEEPAPRLDPMAALRAAEERFRLEPAPPSRQHPMAMGVTTLRLSLMPGVFGIIVQRRGGVPRGARAMRGTFWPRRPERSFVDEIAARLKLERHGAGRAEVVCMDHEQGRLQMRPEFLAKPTDDSHSAVFARMIDERFTAEVVVEVNLIPRFGQP